MIVPFGCSVLLTPGVSISLEDAAIPPDLDLIAVRLGTGDAGFALCAFSTRTIRSFNPVVAPFRYVSAAGAPLSTWGYVFDLDARVDSALPTSVFANPSRSSPTISVVKEQRFALAAFQTAAWDEMAGKFTAPAPVPTRFVVSGTIDY